MSFRQSCRYLHPAPLMASRGQVGCHTCWALHQAHVQGPFIFFVFFCFCSWHTAGYAFYCSFSINCFTPYRMPPAATAPSASDAAASMGQPVVWHSWQLPRTCQNSNREFTFLFVDGRLLSGHLRHGAVHGVTHRQAVHAHRLGGVQSPLTRPAP